MDDQANHEAGGERGEYEDRDQCNEPVPQLPGSRMLWARRGERLGGLEAGPRDLTGDVGARGGGSDLAGPRRASAPAAAPTVLTDVSLVVCGPGRIEAATAPSRRRDLGPVRPSAAARPGDEETAREAAWISSVASDGRDHGSFAIPWAITPSRAARQVGTRSVKTGGGDITCACRVGGLGRLRVRDLAGQAFVEDAGQAHRRRWPGWRARPGSAPGRRNRSCR